MGKPKKNLAERVNLKTQKKKSVNPFEVHVNRQKFNVLGRQLKTDRGLPGVSKARAIKKRKATLLQEFKIQNKNNKFYDKRIGEKNFAMTQEDRVIARFSAERMKNHKRKAVFNLAEDEVLTHKGQSIAEIEKFEDPVMSDDEDYGGNKGLDANFVEEANFGGGTLKESKTSRADIIDQLIADSKKRRAERQMVKEKTLQQTEQLDGEWKELLPYVNMGKKEEEAVIKKDTYDTMLAGLKFEARGTPSDKLKTEVEIAEEEANKLRALEEERLRRMRGEEPNSTPKMQHRSADDLDDGFEIQEESFELTYDKEGNPINYEKFKDDTVVGKKAEEEEKEEGSDEEDSADEEDKVDEEDSADEEDKVDEEDKADEDESANEEELGDDLSDLQVNDDVDEEKEVDSEDEIEASDISKVEVNETTEKQEKKKVTFSQDVTLVTFKKDPIEVSKKSVLDNEVMEKLLDNAHNDIPFTIQAPDDCEGLKELLKERTPEQQALIVQRIIKCTHPSLNEKNKEKLENLFALLMQHLNDADESESWRILKHLAPYLFDLTQFSPQNAAFCLSEVLIEKHDDYIRKKHKYPSSETFLFLKLVPLLFPTSDKRHPVTTPSFVFMSEMLRICNVTTRRTISAGLFLVSLFTEYIWLSKRVTPEALNFLSGVIAMASPVSDLPVLSPFNRNHKFLFLQQSQENLKELDLKMPAYDFIAKGPKIDNNFRIRSVYCTLKLLHIFVENYEEIPESKLLFEPIKKHLDLLEINKYPAPVREAHKELLEIMERMLNKELVPLTIEAKKPKALRLYEPSIHPVYENQKKKLAGDKAEHTKLLYKYKKEMKGALREIRRDRSFIANLKFKEQAASDAERKRKVQEIYSWGAQQEGEYKKLKRKKH